MRLFSTSTALAVIRSKRNASEFFDCAKVSDHPLMAGVSSPLRIAHSRWNELHERELVASITPFLRDRAKPASTRL